MSRETRTYKVMAIRAAKELFYPKAVIDRLKEATSDGEIERIMRAARLADNR